MELDPDQTHVEDQTLVAEPMGGDSADSARVLCSRYKLIRKIGQGGMAQVWLATDLVLNRQVAVKMLHPHLGDNPTFVARFRAEAIAAAKFSHQNIVGVFDTCSEGDREAIVMEYLAARTLRQHLDEHGTLEVATTVRIALRVLAALEAAHAEGLVHRDIKPSNILLCDDGRVKIADFGIAKVNGQIDLTQGGLIGTAAYLAPEQVTEDPVDGRTDLYALGIVMYECLTGTTPFKADTKAALANVRVHTDPVDPRRLRVGIPPELARTIMIALARDPNDRFPTAADLRAALLDGPVPPTAITPVEVDETGELPAMTASFTHSERRWILPAVVLVLIAVALTTVALLIKDSADDLVPRSTTTDVPAERVAPIPVARAVPFDPQGDDSENNSSAERAIDGDPSTAWKTEGYEPPGFSRGKQGVGLGVDLKSRSLVQSVAVEGSSNGWSAKLFVIDRNSLDGFDPESAHPVGAISDFGGSAEVTLTGSPDQRTGSTVLLWITNLGSSSGDGRHRVEVSTISVSGTPRD